MKKQIQITLALAAVLTTSVHAHSAWIVPSQTQLSKDGEWVTFDAGASNQLFVANHAALDLDRIQILSPSNKKIALENAMQGKVRSVFDLQLNQKGTYQILRGGERIFARYEKDGKRKRWWGSTEDYKAGNYPKDIPSEAFNSYIAQVETFVTLGEPTKATVAPAKKGLDIEYLTHPNDLIDSEVATFRLLIDGKPASGLNVEIIKGNSQYRNNLDPIKLISDNKGEIKVQWKTAGMYWLHIKGEDDKGITPSKKRNLSYTAVLEVLPE